jgi:transcription antitermination factor NusG
VLLRETSVHPATLFEEWPAREDRRWWVLHTKPRQEKALARQLHRMDTPFYLPLLERRSLIRGRVMTSHVPLFTSYVFLLGNTDERVGALSTPHVVRSLEVRGQRELQGDLAQIHRLIRSGLPLAPERQFRPGVVVEIITGPLAGLRGPILREASGNRFVVQVRFIQQGVSVTIEDFAIAAVEDPEA